MDSDTALSLLRGHDFLTDTESDVEMGEPGSLLEGLELLTNEDDEDQAPGTPAKASPPIDGLPAPATARTIRRVRNIFKNAIDDIVGDHQKVIALRDFVGHLQAEGKKLGVDILAGMGNIKQPDFGRTATIKVNEVLAADEDAKIESTASLDHDKATEVKESENDEFMGDVESGRDESMEDVESGSNEAQKEKESSSNEAQKEKESSSDESSSDEAQKEKESSSNEAQKEKESSSDEAASTVEPENGSTVEALKSGDGRKSLIDKVPEDLGPQDAVLACNYTHSAVVQAYIRTIKLQALTREIQKSEVEEVLHEIFEAVIKAHTNDTTTIQQKALKAIVFVYKALFTNNAGNNLHTYCREYAGKTSETLRAAHMSGNAAQSYQHIPVLSNVFAQLGSLSMLESNYTHRKMFKQLLVLRICILLNELIESVHAKPEPNQAVITAIDQAKVTSKGSIVSLSPKETKTTILDFIAKSSNYSVQQLRAMRDEGAAFAEFFQPYPKGIGYGFLFMAGSDALSTCAAIGPIGCRAAMAVLMERWPFQIKQVSDVLTYRVFDPIMSGTPLTEFTAQMNPGAPHRYVWGRIIEKHPKADLSQRGPGVFMNAQQRLADKDDETDDSKLVATSTEAYSLDNSDWATVDPVDEDDGPPVRRTRSSYANGRKTKRNSTARGKAKDVAEPVEEDEVQVITQVGSPSRGRQEDEEAALYDFL